MGAFFEGENMKRYFTKTEILLWISSVILITASFLLFDRENYNIIPSTISVTTSFIAVYLTFRRSPYFASAYASNDVVLIVLWIMASLCDVRYIPVVVCFAVFLVNDVYGFISWRRMRAKQAQNQ